MGVEASSDREIPFIFDIQSATWNASGHCYIAL